VATGVLWRAVPASQDSQRAQSPRRPGIVRNADLKTVVAMQPGEPVQLELDPDEDGPVCEWFYEHRALAFAQHGVPGGGAGGVNGPSYKRWRLGLPVMATLYRLAGQLLSDMIDPNYFYLFDPSSLISAKSLNLCIPGGPKFEPLFRCAFNNVDNCKRLIHVPLCFALCLLCFQTSAFAHSTCSG
jgi:hypothetical protein